MGRYDDFNLNSGQYIPQYAGTPLDEVQRTNEALQERHYRNIADLSNLQLLKAQYESRVTPGAKDYISTQFNDIDESLKAMAENGAENSTAKISALKNRFLGDQGVLGAIQRSEEIKKEVELENNLIAQGRTPIRKAGVREAALNTPVIDPETGQIHKLFTQPYQSTVAPYEDPVPHMSKIWAELHPDSYESELRNMNSKAVKDAMKVALGTDGDVDIPLFFESITSSGISGKKIHDNLENAFASYKETPAYKQAVDYSSNPAAEAKRQKDIFYKHGMLKVFNNLSREDKFNPLADDLLRKRAGAAALSNPNPDLSITTAAPKTPIDNLDQINEKGDVTETHGSVALEGLMQSLTGKPHTREMEDVKVGGVTVFRRPKVGASEELTKAAVPYYKAAASLAGKAFQSEDELKKWAGSDQGKTALQAYKDGFLKERYKSPTVYNLDPEKARDAQNLFVNSSLSQRKLIPFTEPTKVIHMSDLALGKADDEALNVSKWYTNDPGKIRFVGEVAPQNWLGEGQDFEGEFANAKVIEVPEGDGKDGRVKRYYVSNLASETNGINITEKALSNLGQRIPGVPTTGSSGVQVFQTLNDYQKQNLYEEYKDKGDVSQILQWPTAIVVKDGDDVIFAPNYKTAALELAKKKKYVLNSK